MDTVVKSMLEEEAEEEKRVNLLLFTCLKVFQFLFLAVQLCSVFTDYQVPR